MENNKTIVEITDGICKDYNINVDHLTEKLKNHFITDMLNELVNNGYLNVENE